MALSTAGYRQYLLLLAQQNVEFRLPVSPRCGARAAFFFFFLPLGSFRGLSARGPRRRIYSNRALVSLLIPGAAEGNRKSCNLWVFADEYNGSL